MTMFRPHVTLDNKINIGRMNLVVCMSRFLIYFIRFDEWPLMGTEKIVTFDWQIKIVLATLFRCIFFIEIYTS